MEVVEGGGGRGREGVSDRNHLALSFAPLYHSLNWPDFSLSPVGDDAETYLSSGAHAARAKVPAPRTARRKGGRSLSSSSPILKTFLGRGVDFSPSENKKISENRATRGSPTLPRTLPPPCLFIPCPGAARTVNSFPIPPGAEREQGPPAIEAGRGLERKLEQSRALAIALSLSLSLSLLLPLPVSPLLFLFSDSELRKLQLFPVAVLS